MNRKCLWNLIIISVTALIILPAWPGAFSQTPLTLTVATQYADGAPLSGMWTTLRSSSGQLLATGFSPVSFTVLPGLTYTVSVGNYQQIAFHHWDSGSTVAQRQVSAPSSTITAFYVSPSHPLLPQSYDRPISDGIAVSDSSSRVLPQSYDRPVSDEISISSSVSYDTQQSFAPVTHMADTTASYGVLVNSPSQIFAGEWVKPASQLVGDQIDSITLRLQRSGSPPGTFTVGVYDSNLALKKSFGIVPTSALPPAMADMEFTIPDIYTIQAGDRIGLFYNGSPGGVSVMMDKVTSDSMFDGPNTQRVRYGTSWITYDLNEDLYMILKQTKAPPGGQPPTAQGQSVSVNENSQRTITLAGSDPEGQPVKFYMVNGPAHAIVSLVNGSQLNYRPYSYYDGPDSFTFVTSDGINDSAPATVSINVANTAADTTSDIAVITEFENGHSHTGAFVELRRNGAVVNSGSSHIDFQVNNGQTYTVAVGNFQNFVFHHWKDNGSTNPARSINISQDTALVAVYRLL